MKIWRLFRDNVPWIVALGIVGSNRGQSVLEILDIIPRLSNSTFESHLQDFSRSGMGLVVVSSLTILALAVAVTMLMTSIQFLGEVGRQIFGILARRVFSRSPSVNLLKLFRLLLSRQQRADIDLIIQDLDEDLAEMKAQKIPLYQRRLIIAWHTMYNIVTFSWGGVRNFVNVVVYLWRR